MNARNHGQVATSVRLPMFHPGGGVAATQCHPSATRSWRGSAGGEHAGDRGRARRPTAHAELVVAVLQVPLDRADAQVQPGRDLLVAEAVGRELEDMVWLRHRRDAADPAPVGRSERLLLGAAVTALLLLPFVNLLAPILGAAAATHLIHRKELTRDAA